jgi:WD40 repeat protein
MKVVETSSSSSTSMAISLKWNKRVYEFNIPCQSTGRTIKEKVYELTQVPIERQKIMGKEYWKGMLKDDADFSSISLDHRQPNSDSNVVGLKLTMIGSAEVLQQPTTTTTFVEDMTPEQQQHIEQQAYQQSLKNVTGMIPAIQTLPQDRSKDSQKQVDVMYPYNRLVYGLPQYQIENVLKEQLMSSHNTTDVSFSPHLSGRVVMTLGLELQRAYINDLTTLSDGSLISGLEDGHIHLWKHGQRVLDLIHGPSPSNNSPRGVESVLAIAPYTTGEEAVEASGALASFVTAGRGTLRVWTEEGEPILSVSTLYPYASPTGLVQLQDEKVGLLCLAARFAVTPPPSNRPHLAPQDGVGRQRLEHIEMQEALVEQTMSRLRRTIQFWYGQSHDDDRFVLLSTMVEATAPVTALISWNIEGDAFLAAGDEQGGIQVWKMTISNRQPEFTKLQHYQIGSPYVVHSAIVCMKYDNAFRRLFVSTKSIDQPIAPMVPSDVGLIPIVTDISQGVHVLNVNTISSPVLTMTIKGHKDAVSSIQPLPNGDLITAGGKFDATLKVWSRSQLTATASSLPYIVLTEPFMVNLCQDVGYVFALTVLDDMKNLPNGAAHSGESHRTRHFGIAAARYNVIKVIL